MDTLNDYDNNQKTNSVDTNWDADLETKINEIIAKINEIVTWINNQ
tara:strand:- start:399 stop:536 length:138 start_codon:yes stop_codon:yes gene_type:complete